MEKQVIIFGAGNFGRSAFEYYGAEMVCCFVDNSKEKIGKEYLGKTIISFDQLLNEYVGKDDYRLIIACAHSQEICVQLKNAGIDDYSFYNPSIAHMLDIIRKNFSKANIGNENIYLCGIGNETNDIYWALKSTEFRHNIGGIIKSKYDIPVKLDFNIPQVDKPLDGSKIIITSVKNHHALHVGLKISYPKASVINPFKQVAYYDTKEVVVNPYENKNEEISEDEWNRITQDSINKTEIREYVETIKEKVPLFEFIEVETINRCNGMCSFCPVNKKVDPRIETKMEKGLFKKIIDELSSLNYSGELSLFSNNEPLLDERIIEFHKYAREKLPKARMHLFTNGTLLSLEIFLELMKYLDELIIDNYQQELKLLKPVAAINEYVSTHPELKEKVTIVLRKPHEILTSRGGDAPNRTNVQSYGDETCALPFEQMIIRPDGKVSLCCNDPLGRNTLGDVNNNSLQEIWYGDKYKMVRQCIAEGRKNWKQCEFCDTFYLY